MVMLTEDQVREKLKEVVDPELLINIVDLGLIYDVKLKIQDSRFKVFVKMTLTSPGCPLASTFESLVTKAVKSLEGVEAVEIELTWEPAWSMEKMSEEAKAELGMF